MRRITVLVLGALALFVVACGGGGQPAVVMDEPVPAGAEGAQVVNLEFTTRSEERRVGKECRSRGSPYP